MKKTSLFQFRTLFAAALLMGFFLVACAKKQDAEQSTTSADNTAALVSEADQNRGNDLPQEDYLISCEGVGKIKMSYDYAKLKELFGEKVSEIEAGHDGDYCDVVLSAGDTLTVYWDFQTEVGKKIGFIVVSNPNYKTQEGFYAGMPVSELESLIGKPFEVYHSVEMGRLIVKDEKVNKCFSLQLRQKNNPNQYIADLLPQLKGKNQDVTFSSDESNFVALNPYLDYLEVFNTK
ncbi:hypothetical protein [Hugenholtzia roseola]|uniref:hypothetical protein n=1 Tax=Hugenholtzia roseola TaxID=1002 RepID=UPI00041652DA|nr:hypothetical protein [Hugenholtzia roseola]